MVSKTGHMLACSPIPLYYGRGSALGPVWAGLDFGKQGGCVLHRANKLAGHIQQPCGDYACTAAGADKYVRRVPMALGVKPCSIKVTKTALGSLFVQGSGRYR